jgi:arylsulfatase A-like enzyme
MAGGGVKAGSVYGETDEMSYNIVKDPVHVRDLHATILHLMGIDHERLSFKAQGLDQRLTGVVPASVVKGLLA